MHANIKQNLLGCIILWLFLYVQLNRKSHRAIYTTTDEMQELFVSEREDASSNTSSYPLSVCMQTEPGPIRH